VTGLVRQEEDRLAQLKRFALQFQSDAVLAKEAALYHGRKICGIAGDGCIGTHGNNFAEGGFDHPEEKETQTLAIDIEEIADGRLTAKDSFGKQWIAFQILHARQHSIHSKTTYAQAVSFT
jgi:hypothetical protein